MNNKGFTLIELILVISVLAMLALIATPNVIKMINKNKVDNYNSTIESIMEASELYVSNHRYDLQFKNSSGNNDFCNSTDTKSIYANITLNDLINSKDMPSSVKNFCNDSNFPGTTNIKVTLNCGTRQFSYEILELTKKNDVTDEYGKIKDGKYCTDLY